MNNDNLEENCINLPTELEIIEGNVFDGSSAITKVVGYNKIQSIGAASFKDLTSLVSLTLPFVGHVRGNYTLADGEVASIGYDNFGYIFGAYTGPVGNEIPAVPENGTTKINQIYDASNLGSLTNANIPNTLREVNITDDTVIGVGAFSNIPYINTIT